MRKLLMAYIEGIHAFKSRPEVVFAVLSLANPKARGAKAEDFMETSLVEEIKKSGFIDRLYGR